MTSVIMKYIWKQKNVNKWADWAVVITAGGDDISEVDILLWLSLFGWEL